MLLLPLLRAYVCRSRFKSASVAQLLERGPASGCQGRATARTTWRVEVKDASCGRGSAATDSSLDEAILAVLTAVDFEPTAAELAQCDQDAQERWAQAHDDDRACA